MPKVDIALIQSSIGEIALAARRSEEIGFDGLITAEAAHEPYLPLMIAAEHTKRSELLTGIALAFPRSPMITAYTAWDLQRYSDGRFILGLGTQVKGHNERRFNVPWHRPGPRLRDMIRALRAIWKSWQSGEPLDYQGEFYRFDLMTPFFNPGPQPNPDIPIYIAGVNPYICRLAGELCNGLHVHPLHTEKYVNEVIRPLIAEGAALSGRDPAEVVLASSCFVVTGDDEESMQAASDIVKQQIAFYASTRTYARVLETHGWEELSPRLNELSRKGDWDKMGGLINDEMLEELAVVAPRDQVALRLKQKYDGLLDRISLYLPYQPGEDEDWWREIAATVSS